MCQCYYPTALLRWGAIIGLGVFFAYWAFPRVVNSGFDPAIESIESHLTRVEIGESAV
jgi:hypothetical protein